MNQFYTYILYYLYSFLHKQEFILRLFLIYSCPNQIIRFLIFSVLSVPTINSILVSYTFHINN